MATTTVVTLIDSINGSTEGVETVTFFHPMTGQKMTIELDEKNRKAMGTHLERMNKYFDAAEAVVEPVAPNKPKATKNNETSKIREWARANGFTIGDRGRISAEILTAYTAAQDVIYPDAEVVQDLEVIEPAESKTEEVSTETGTQDEATAAEELINALDDLNDDSVQSMTDEQVNELLAEIEAENKVDNGTDQE